MASKLIVLALVALFAGAHAASVYDTAKAAGLKTLVAAIDAANFKGAFDDPDLKGTVFAPSETAFAALIEALGVTPEELLANKALLRKVLKNHAVHGAPVKSSMIGSSKTVVHSWLGQALAVRKRSSGGVSVFFGKGLGGEAKVVTADVKANGAVVHVVDQVLVPK